MQEYLRSLLAAAAIAALASLLLPEKEARMKRLLEFGISLLVLTVLCQPLVHIGSLSDALQNIRMPGLSTFWEEKDPDTWAAMERAVGQGIESDLASQYALPAACFSADVVLAQEGEELKISALTLTLRGEGRLLDLYAVRDYASRTYQTNCEVTEDG